MNKLKIRDELISKLNQENAFWSYEMIDTAHISDEALIANVLIHLDIEDIQNLFRLFPKRIIKQVWKDEMLPQGSIYDGLNRLYAFLFFDIKNPDRYIRDFKNKRYKFIVCKD